MEVSFSANAASTRLKRFSLRLRAGEHPYYLHSPRGPSEPAPGWYWKPANAEHPQYLGFNSFDAEYTLRRKLEDLRAAGAATPDEQAAAA
jgi:hypothetical protein